MLAQSYRDLELIIVDDGSTDRTSDVIDSFSDQRIRKITQPNHGLASALNAGIEAARGKFIARHDADDISLPDRIFRQVQYLERKPDVALLGSNYHVIDENDQVAWTTDVFTERDDLKLAEIASNQFGHGAVMIRATALRGTEAYDERYKSACDVDLWTRLSRISRIANLKEPLYQWRNVGEGLSSSEDGMALTASEVRVLRAREFEYFAEHRGEFRTINLRPASIRGGRKRYLVMKNTMFRDLALLASYAGRRGLAIKFLVLGATHAPWIKRTYKQLFFTLFRPQEIERFPYDYI